MKKIYIAAMFLLGSTALIGATQIFNGEHFTGIEYQHSRLKGTGNDVDNINVYTLTLGKGSYSFINYPINFEGTFKYDIKGENHSISDDISYSSFGGRFQYNGWGNKGFIIGMKGSLDYDNFYEKYDNYFSRYIIEGDYPRKSGKHKDEEDIGVKFYGDAFKKLGHGFTVGFWNEIVVGKEETSDSIPVVLNKGFTIANGDNYANESVSITITPKVIYENFLTDGIRFVFEGYMENRKYYNQTFDVDGIEKDQYYKYVLTPQLSIKGDIGNNINYNSYIAFENEGFQYLDYWQHIFKVTPKIEYKKDKLEMGIAGGGYDYEDEIGIVFDNKELFAYKKSDSYSALIFSPKAYIEYNIWKHFSIGHETTFRHGEWKTDDQDGYLDETSYIFYWKYQKKIYEDIEFILKNSYEIYRNSANISMDKMLPEEDIIRLTVGVKAYF